MGQDESKEQIIARRIELFKQFRQGDGLTLKKLEALGDEVAIFGVETPSDALELINMAAETLLDHPYQHHAAIRNALALGTTVQGNLSERRADLLERSDVKLRMLINHEDLGAELLARQVDMILRLRSDNAKTLEEVPEVATQYLRELLPELSESRLDEIRKAMEQALPELMKGSAARSGIRRPGGEWEWDS